jgi:hypothetical protein
VRVVAVDVVDVCVYPRNERSEFGVTGPSDLLLPLKPVKVTTPVTELGEKLPIVDSATLPGVTMAKFKASRVVYFPGVTVYVVPLITSVLNGALTL